MTWEDSTSISLIERIKAGATDAWKQLVELYGPLVYGWCRSSHLNTEDTADITQEVFRAVLGGIDSFRRERPTDTFRGWLKTITQNKIRDHFRKHKGTPQAVGGTDAQAKWDRVPENFDESQISQSSSSGSLLHRALESIKPNYNETTWQAFWKTTVEGRLPIDVSEELGISVDSIYQAKSRILRRLREILGDTEND